MSVSGDEALLGQTLDGRYLITELIAHGGMAVVYLAEDQRLDRPVAIKVMRQGLGDAAQFTERFRLEAKAAAKLNHRNVVAVFDQGADGQVTYLVMEYVPGRTTLRDVMRAEAPMGAIRALEIIEQVLVALSAAHEAHLVHRDVKPENVLLTPAGEIKVADFGLARAVSTASTATGSTLIGTVSYLAPEIVLNAGTDARSDVYAIGAMLYEMLTGLKPHQGESPIQVAYKHVHEDIPAPSGLRPGLPDYVDALVERATARDRDQRSTDARVLLHQVRRVLQALRAGLDSDPELTADLRPSTQAHPLVPSAVAAGPDPDDPTQPVPLHDPDAMTSPLNLGPGVAAAAERTHIFGEGAPSAGAGPAAPARSASAGAPAVAPPTPDEQRQRRGRRLMIAVLALVLLAGGLGWYYSVGRYVDAPALTNLAEQQAIDKADQAGFTLKVTARAFSETVPLGTIISTDPEPGGRILPGGTINATVSKGKERYAIPDLRGQTVDEARATLAATKLELGGVTEAFDQEIEAGRVIGIDGAAVGDLVKRDTTVAVVVSKGREPLSITDFTGKTQDEATAGLQQIGFTVKAQAAFSDTVPAGVVISQNPASGNGLRGDTITITVSQGPELFPVPDLNGLRRNEAEKVLQDAGFQARSIGIGNFTVRLQDPAAGSAQKRGTTINITGF